MKKYYLQFILIAIFFCTILFIPVTRIKADAAIKLPDPQIKISDELTEKLTKKPTYNSKTKKWENRWIADYIEAVYKYLIGIVGILATVVMMIGGVIWITAGGNASRIGEAKAWIGGALMGLVLALSSYTILYQINDETVKMKPISYTQITPYIAPTSESECHAQGGKVIGIVNQGNQHTASQRCYDQCNGMYDKLTPYDDKYCCICELINTNSSGCCAYFGPTPSDCDGPYKKTRSDCKSGLTAPSTSAGFIETTNICPPCNINNYPGI